MATPASAAAASRYLHMVRAVERVCTAQALLVPEGHPAHPTGFLVTQILAQLPAREGGRSYPRPPNSPTQHADPGEERKGGGLLCGRLQFEWTRACERERVHLVGSHGRWKRPCLQTAHMTI